MRCADTGFEVSAAFRVNERINREGIIDETQKTRQPVFGQAVVLVEKGESKSNIY